MDTMSLRIIGGGAEKAGILGVESGIEDLVAKMGGEQESRIVAGRVVTVHCVVANEAVRPLHPAGFDAQTADQRPSGL